jgi:hypothetical protein
MNAKTLASIIPAAPRTPSDYLTLLTYTPGQTKAQKIRTNATLAAEHNIDTDGATCADEL